MQMGQGCVAEGDMRPRTALMNGQSPLRKAVDVAQVRVLELLNIAVDLLEAEMSIRAQTADVAQLEGRLIGTE